MGEVKNPDHYKLSVSGVELETKDILNALVDEVDQPPAVSAWTFNAGKYFFRAFKKHKNPVVDITKCIQCLVFVLEKVVDSKLSFDIKDEDGNSILKGE